MRLIDADAIKYTEYINGDITVSKEEIERQPTAYDIDKVVSELEIERKTANNTYNSFNMYVDLGRVFGLEKAIEIVKHGGAGTETKTIRDKAIEWNNHSSKKVPYEFIDFVEGKREIAKDDDVCEWEQLEDGYKNCRYSFDEIESVDFFKYCPYCGKKIKVVK